METNVHYTIVGAFVILLCAAIALTIIWLSSGFSTQVYTTYLVYMQESVSGLNIDAPVEYNGVAVGAVKLVKLDPNDPHIVDLELDIKADTPITQGTTATLTTRGITGITFIALKDNGYDLRPLVALKGQPYPVIKTAPSFFMRIDLVLDKLSNHIQRVSEAIQTLLDPQNQASIKETLVNLRQITGSLASNTQQLDKIFKHTADFTQHMTPLLQSSRGAMVTLQNQTLPETYRLLSNLNDTARNLSQFSQELKQNPSILIRGKLAAPPGPGEKR